MAEPGAAGRPRAVLLIANAAAPYSRGLRVARSLVQAGYEVEIAAVAEAGVPVEERDGAVLIRRYRPRGPFAGDAGPRAPLPPGRLARIAAINLDRIRKVAFWPIHVRGWWAALHAELRPADLYHAFGILTIKVAADLAADARRSGRAGVVVYDVIDVVLESNNYDRLPGPLLAWYRWRERRWTRRASAVITV